MSGNGTKKTGTKLLAWILIGAMLLTFVFAIIMVILSQNQYASLFGGGQTCSAGSPAKKITISTVSAMGSR